MLYRYYRLGNNNQTDQRDETGGLKRERLEGEGLEREILERESNLFDL
jgi:hypothetical protein